MYCSFADYLLLKRKLFTFNVYVHEKILLFLVLNFAFVLTNEASLMCKKDRFFIIFVMKPPKYYLLFLLLFTWVKSNAQNRNFSCEVKYRQITAFFDTTKKYLTPSVLLFSANQSIYVQGETTPLGAGINTSVPASKFNAAANIAVFIDLSSQRMTSSQRASGERWVVEDSLFALSWAIKSNETRQIGKYKCLKAEVSTRGRTYTAWFTPEIPVPVGPWKLYGLPGLILEATDSTGEVTFLLESLTMPMKTDLPIVSPVPKAGKKMVNEKEFVVTRRESLDKMNKMSNTAPKPEGVISSSTKIRTRSMELFPDE